MNHFLKTVMAGCLLGSVVPARSAEDVLVAGFDDGGFGDWKVTGKAFGEAPVTGSLPNQMEVSGFEGAGYLSSYHGGDEATGKAVSPAFEITRPYLNFLIGGGGFEGETCVNLRSETGKLLFTAVGPNVHPGGSEKLEWHTWDVSKFDGDRVRIEVIDRRKEGWGHISVDQFGLSSDARVLEVEKKLMVNKRYLVWPIVMDQGKSRRFVFRSQDGWMSYATVALAERPDHWVFTDLANLQGETITVSGRISSDLKAAWDKVVLSDTFPGEEEVYHESRRPRYHFTSRRGWLNDPNGLVYSEGKWHLCYQHNPYNVFWDNMTWGHAVSDDLFHWVERPPALWPGELGVMFSGSGFIVPPKHSGLPITSNPGIGLAFTAWGEGSIVPGKKATQGVAYSNDGGRTFSKFAGNPVIDHIIGGNRDPKVFWHDPSRRWVMALYHDGSEYGIHVSKDLVSWEQTSTYQIPGDSECPDLFPLPLEGDPDQVRWIVWGANGVYMIGDFDGRKFEPSSAPQRNYWGNVYAGQSYDHAPDGRRVHIGWMRGDIASFHGAPFSLQMSLPMDFRLRSFDGKPRLWIEPSKEVESLRKAIAENTDITTDGTDLGSLASIEGKSFEIDATIDLEATDAQRFGFRIFGEPFAWDSATKTFSGAGGTQVEDEGKVHLRVFSDVGTCEVFVNGTYVARYLEQQAPPVELIAEGGKVHFDRLSLFALDSVWK
ncbi:glycoside hydrolase family 32 protein [Haloferula sargassicola]|uniref:glycoside hydrolase family 32 protein n=1 Tax=Haloferula sargassicola TaxID=490096 RepID=UPI0033657A59